MPERKLKPLFKTNGTIRYLTRVPTPGEFRKLCNKKQMLTAVVAVPFSEILSRSCYELVAAVEELLIPPEDDGATMLREPTHRLLGSIPGRKTPGTGYLLVKVVADARDTLEALDAAEKRARTE